MSLLGALFARSRSGYYQHRNMNMFHQFIERFVAVRSHGFVHHNEIERIFLGVILNAIRNKPNFYFEIVRDAFLGKKFVFKNLEFFAGLLFDNFLLQEHFIRSGLDQPICIENRQVRAHVPGHGNSPFDRMPGRIREINGAQYCLHCGFDSRLHENKNKSHVARKIRLRSPRNMIFVRSSKDQYLVPLWK